MPIYEYRCLKCDGVFEALQKFSDEPLSRCKFCQGKVERLISSSSFQLKGSGWYLTDYARKSSSSSETKESAPKSSESKSSDSKAPADTSTTASPKSGTA